jgi:endonuclease/exonuclease/phosphatase family metal-dependent hydrolase
MRIFRFTFFAITLLCYLSVLVSPAAFWPAGFFALLIPLILLLHLIFFIWHLKKRKLMAFLHLAMLAMGFAFIKATAAISWNADEKDDLGVLSYNVRVFNNYSYLDSSEKLIDWTVANSSGIKCLQEYYNKPGSPVFGVENKLKKAGWAHLHKKILLQDREGAEFGIAIFSQYPFVQVGEITDEYGQFQNAIYADILLSGDTVRMYNVHLESMSIDENDVVDAGRLRKMWADTGLRLKNGFISRARQINHIVEHMENSPHETILCGDFNELPYSYPYFAVRSTLDNAFEEAGSGFGFSFNGRLFFLRIDNQFFSPGLRAIRFDTHHDVRYSDHFPISASYSFSR